MELPDQGARVVDLAQWMQPLEHPERQEQHVQSLPALADLLDLVQRVCSLKRMVHLSIWYSHVHNKRLLRNKLIRSKQKL